MKVQVELNEQLEQDNIALEEELGTAEQQCTEHLATLKSMRNVRQQLTILSTKYEGITQAQAKLESAIAEVAESKKLEAVLSEKIRHLKKHQHKIFIYGNCKITV